LPHLSNTPPPPPPEPTPGEPVEYREARPIAVSAGIGAEVWLSAGIGVVLMLIGRSFASWAMARMSGREFDTGTKWIAGPKMGQPVDYWELSGHTALSDSAIFLFGLAMMLEALVLLVYYSGAGFKKPVVVLALAITVAATGYNLIAVVTLLGAGIMPLMSILAVAFGGYMAAYEWRLLKAIDHRA
jgi:hypothetical protein